MTKTGPTEVEIDALANAMCMVLNDLAEGNGVCDVVKAHARVAMEPFLLEDYGELPDLDWAREVVAARGR
jgi:hypothetical protein